MELASNLEDDVYANAIQKLSNLDWLLHKQSNESIVDSLFTGQLIDISAFSNGKRGSATSQTFNILPVPIAQSISTSGLVTLEHCFTALCQPELVQDAASVERTTTGNTPVTCSTVVRRRAGLLRRESLVPSPIVHMPGAFPLEGVDAFTANDSAIGGSVFKTSTPIRDSDDAKNVQLGTNIQRRCLLKQLPECLIIQLKRFYYSAHNRCSSKLHLSVCLPLKGLDLRDFYHTNNPHGNTIDTGCHRYDLYGLCVHLGANTTHDGHYVSYSLTNDGRWFRFDDDSVAEVNMEYELTTEEVRQNVYILFYKAVS